MAAVRRLAYAAADCGLLSFDLAAIIHRVKGVRKLGSRLGNWLTAGEAAIWQVYSQLVQVLSSMSPMRGDVKERFSPRPLREEMDVAIGIQPDL